MPKVLSYRSSLCPSAEERQPLGGVIGCDSLGAQFFEDAASFLPGLGGTETILTGDGKPEPLDHFIEAGTNSGIRDSEFGLHILDDAPVLDEDLQEREEIGSQPAESIEREVAFDPGSTMPALQLGDVKLRIADRALAGSLMKWLAVVL
jgi:hypothetical protein